MQSATRAQGSKADCECAGGGAKHTHAGTHTYTAYNNNTRPHKQEPKQHMPLARTVPELWLWVRRLHVVLHLPGVVDRPLHHMVRHVLSTTAHDVVNIHRGISENSKATKTCHYNAMATRLTSLPNKQEHAEPSNDYTPPTKVPTRATRWEMGGGVAGCHRGGDVSTNAPRCPPRTPPWALGNTQDLSWPTAPSSKYAAAGAQALINAGRDKCHSLSLSLLCQVAIGCNTQTTPRTGKTHGAG